MKVFTKQTIDRLTNNTEENFKESNNQNANFDYLLFDDDKRLICKKIISSYK